MELDRYLFFITTAIGLLVMPGNMTILALNHGMRYGVKKSVGTALGSMAAGLVTMIISMAGLAAIVQTNKTVYLGIKWLGAAYLVYLGIDCIRASNKGISGIHEGQGPGNDRSVFKLFWQSFLIGMGNPKGIIFFAAFFPQFINVESPKLPQFLILAGTFMCLDFINMISYAGLAHVIIRFLKGEWAGKIFNYVTGVIFIFVGTFVAFYNR